MESCWKEFWENRFPATSNGQHGTCILFPSWGNDAIQSSYLPDSHEGWKVRYLINKAFEAGILFGVEEISQQDGRLIWNPDIPSKTNKTGGIANNGYPDLNYFQNLRDALNAKGIE
uniref:E3 ubiquitin-protein ligase DTX3L-like isoform X2 n=1 Tax=Styela clava TaxID=7725 RepID=UPI0019396C42|nr:E3 ubiquitin-protein ligase DTX3L-like isoform X2 [Styela clava]